MEVLPEMRKAACKQKGIPMILANMPLPKNCGACRTHADGWCYMIDEFEEQPGPLDFEKRPDWCPICKELVLCRDCERNPKYNAASAAECPYINDFLSFRHVPKDDWYCIHVKRKEEESGL